MEAAGGIDYLVRIAAGIIRKSPRHVTIIAPLVAYLFTFLAGTGHIFYPLLPVIYEVAMKGRVRPERPIAVATIASQQAITASPVSAATAALIALLGPKGIGLPQILMICVPSTLLGVIVAALVQTRIGVELDQDPEYLRRVAAGELTMTKDSEASASSAPLAAAGGLVGVDVPGRRLLIVVCCGLFPVDCAKVGAGGCAASTVSMPMTIAMIMLTVAAAMLLFTARRAAQIVKTKTCQAGITAVIGILGLAWLGDTFIDDNSTTIIGGLSRMAEGVSGALFGRTVRHVDAALQPGGDDADAHAAGIDTRHRPGGAGGNVPGGERIFLHPDLRHAHRRGEFRSQRDDADRQIHSESFVHDSRADLHDRGASARACHRRSCFSRRRLMDSSITQKLEAPARAMGVPVDELVGHRGEGQASCRTTRGHVCFTNRRRGSGWGSCWTGEVDIVRGLHGRQTHLATLPDGALISEGILLDELRSFRQRLCARRGTRVLQMPRAVLEQVKSDKPEIYYRIVARVAQRISDRLRAASELLGGPGRHSAADLVVSHRA